MAGSLVHIGSAVASGSAATLSITGIDSTYNVYMVKGFGIENTTDLEDLRGRVTTSGTPDSDSQYDHAFKLFKASGSFADESNTNQDHWRLIDGLGNATNEQAEFIMYLFNFNNSSEYSFFTFDSSYIHGSSGVLMGYEGGGVHTVAETNDGISFHLENSDNFSAGTFTLYGFSK